MCGRIEYIVTDKKILEEHYGATLIEGYAEQFGKPRYNIAPTAHTPIVMSENPEEIIFGHWGYAPGWAKASGSSKEVINARAESVLTKPYFHSSAMKRRCLIPVTGFFEWQRAGGKKIPYHFHMQGEIFSLAGLYTNVADEKGLEMPHYAIITTEAGGLMAPVHNRMPVVIEKSDEETWVSDGLDEMEIAQLLVPAPERLLERDQISTLVNNPRNNRPEILKPVIS